GGPHRSDGTRPAVSNAGWDHARPALSPRQDYGAGGDLRRGYRTLAAALDPGRRSPPPYLSGYAHRGEPLLVSEFGGIALQGSAGWGYGKAATIDALVDRYRERVGALMGEGQVEGFCYTQLTDIEQARH